MECPLVHCILSFESTSYKRIQDAASLPVPLFLVVLHRIIIYISRYHFYNFLEPNSTFTEKKIFVTNFHFLTDSPKPPNLLNRQNPLSVTKAFCWGSLNLENLWFYIWALVVWLLISRHKWLYVTSYPWPPMNKIIF